MDGPILFERPRRWKPLFLLPTQPRADWVMSGRPVHHSGLQFSHLLRGNNTACLVSFTGVMWSHGLCKLGCMDLAVQLSPRTNYIRIFGRGTQASASLGISQVTRRSGQVGNHCTTRILNVMLMTVKLKETTGSWLHGAGTWKELSWNLLRNRNCMFLLHFLLFSTNFRHPVAPSLMSQMILKCWQILVWDSLFSKNTFEDGTCRTTSSDCGKGITWKSAL